MTAKSSTKRTVSGIHQSLDALLCALESALERLPDEPTLEDIGRLVEERKDAAERLATFDPSALTPSEKKVFAGRLRRVLDADQTLALALFARRDDVAAELSRIGHARRLAAASRTSARPVRRVA